MIPLGDAQDHVLARCERLPAMAVPLREALGRVTAASVSSPEQVPPFDNTAVDGYAVRAADLASASATDRAELVVVGLIAAGHAPPKAALQPGQAIKIMTGAPMPPGADAVAMVEWTETVGDRVFIDRTLAGGNHVRRSGEDLQVGDLVFDAGIELTPGHLGVLASIGAYDVQAYGRPKVGVFSTGDELIEGPQALQPGQIRDSNRHTLLALLERDGFATADLGMIADQEDLIEDAVRSGIESCDAIVTSGGVSMGDFDYVKAVLDRIGDMRWMQVRIKPAKPLAFGLVGDTPVFGLPGNPVSSMVSFELFARPGLRKMMGHTELHRPRLIGVAGQPWRRRPDGKIHFVRTRITQDGSDFVVTSAGGQGSHQLTAMAGADALAVLDDGDGVEEGQPLPFFFVN